ncbi:hypothetical protein OSG_eHP3_00070 [environmental Halophage eHP-3]|nr:hypothetical protein OSG_eHP3_00070 [environmental Halophage eHP-3]
MNSDKRALEGSKNRDRFKRLHKNLHPQFYALDIDLALVEKNIHNGSEFPCIVSFIDFKMPGDRATFTEVLTYNQFLSNGVPVHLIESESKKFHEQTREEHRFKIKKYRGGNWRPNPPEYNTETVVSNATWEDLADWENGLRQQRRKEVRGNPETPKPHPDVDTESAATSHMADGGNHDLTEEEIRQIESDPVLTVDDVVNMREGD